MADIMSPEHRKRGEARLVELHEHLLGNTVIGPLGTFHGELFDLVERARAAGDQVSYRTLCYIHDRFCEIRRDISADVDPIKLPPAPVFVQRKLPK